MKNQLLLFASVAFLLVSCDSKDAPVDYILEKNYPMVSALAFHCPEAQLAELELLSGDRFARIAAAGNPAFLDSALFAESEIEAIGSVLAESSVGCLSFLTSRLRASGYYYIYNELPDSSFMKAAVRQDIEGINRAIRVYGQGEPPHYAGIDSISFDVRSRYYINLMEDVRTTALRQCGRALDIFSLPLCIVRNLLEANEREDAKRFEPLAETENRFAVRKAASVEWGDYPYSVVIVPGSGPIVENQPLSPTGKQRAKYASILYKEGKAPFLMVSGGSVHPRLTPYNEAYEMRRYLVEECGVPAEAVFIEPHSRHTTTNLRNCVRIMKAAGFPMDKKGLISSSSFQLGYISQPYFSDLCRKMMLVVPFELGERLCDRELEFLPLECATQVCPIDPMDP